MKNKADRQPFGLIFYSRQAGFAIWLFLLSGFAIRLTSYMFFLTNTSQRITNPYNKLVDGLQIRPNRGDL